MNGFLLNTKFRPGNWIILRDSCERLSPNFTKNIRGFIEQLEKNDVNTVYQYSKCLMFKKYEHQQFNHSPHWGLNSPRGKFLEIDKQINFEDPKNYAYSIRNDIRPKHHFIDHFVRYYLYDSSNHLLLGRENKQQEFLLHEEIRYKFKKYCEDTLGVNLTVNGLLEYVVNNDINYELKYYFNIEPILNDFYCFHKLGHSVEDILARKNKNQLFKI